MLSNKLQSHWQINAAVRLRGSVNLFLESDVREGIRHLGFLRTA